MTTFSLILGFIASILPKLLDILSAPKKKAIPKTSYIKEVSNAQTEQEIEIAWAKHDADLERLL